MICKVFWKRIYIIVPVLLIVFFLCGFYHEYVNLTRLSPQTAHMLYGTLTSEMIRDFSVESGFVWALFYTLLTVYVFFIVTMLISKERKKQITGIVFIILAVLIICLYFWFVRSFKLSF